MVSSEEPLPLCKALILAICLWLFCSVVWSRELEMPMFGGRVQRLCQMNVRDPS